MSTVWDRTAAFLGDNLSALTPLVLLGIFVPLILLGNLMPLMGTAGQTGDLTIGVLVLLLSLATSWAGVAITALALDPAAGRAAAIRTANGRTPAVIGIGFVTMLIVGLLLLPIGIALTASGLDMTALAAGKSAGSAVSGTVNGGAVAFVLFYSLLLGIVLFWGYARCIVLVTPIVVMERRGLGIYARSFVLTRGIAWKVIGLLLLYLCLFWIASSAAKFVFGSVFALLFDGEGTITLASVLTQIVSAGVSTLFSVLAVAFVAKLYLATRDAREAIVEAR